MNDNERTIKMLQSLIEDIQSGKVIIDSYSQKNDNAETTKPDDTVRNYMFTGVARVNFRMQYPEQMRKFEEWVKKEGITTHYA